MPGNAGLGRPKGSRNRFTADLLARMTEGRTPVDFALCVMHTQTAPIQIRLQAAKLALPYVHTRPAPVSEPVELELPAVDTLEGVSKAVAAVLHAVTSAAISAEVGRDLVAILDVQRKGLEAKSERRPEAEENGKPVNGHSATLPGISA